MLIIISYTGSIHVRNLHVDKTQIVNLVVSVLYVGALEDLREIPTAGNNHSTALLSDNTFDNINIPR